MATAKKLPSGSWRAQVYNYTDIDGKRHYQSFTCDDPSPAGKREAEFMAAEFAINKKAKIKGDLTIDEAVNNYISIKEHVLSPSTLRGYKGCKTYLIDIESLKLSQLNEDIVQSWVNKLSKEYAPKTVRNAYGFFGAVLRDNKIVFSDITLPQKIKPTYYVPSDADIKTLTDFFRENDVDMLRAVYLAAYGTLRRSEVCALESTDINGNTIHVHKAVVMDRNKEWITKTTKNVSSDRYIELPQFVIDSFPKEGKIVNITPSILSDRFQHVFNKICIKEFRFHDLRHYSASIMHAIGVPDQYIMARGGWSSDNVLKQIYRGTIDDYNRHYTDKTNDYFSAIQHEIQHKK